MDEATLRATMLQAVLAQGIPMEQALRDADAAVAYVLRGKGTPAKSAGTREQVLDAWASGERGPKIAQQLNIGLSYVSQIVSKARKNGDPRAVTRTRHSPEHLAAIAERARTMGTAWRKERK